MSYIAHVSGYESRARISGIHACSTQVETNVIQSPGLTIQLVVAQVENLQGAEVP